MKERPILMSAPMVKALLAGKKSQTRRVVKLPSWAEPYDDHSLFEFEDVPVNGKTLTLPLAIGKVSGCTVVIPCPYGFPGDRLWVRETFLLVGGESPNARVVYRATNDGPYAWVSPSWRPSIFMPRRASRITLELTNVRVERVQDISEADAKAEGVDTKELRINVNFPGDVKNFPIGSPLESCVTAYHRLWDSINAARGHSWESNPFVWVLEFKKI